MILERIPQEVDRWFLAFHVKQGRWRYERFIPGRYAHVSAFAFLQGPGIWLLIDRGPFGADRTIVWPSGPTMPNDLAQWTGNCSILRVDVDQRPGVAFRFGFGCVSAIKELVGSRSSALTPQGLWRDLVANGATITYELRLGASPAAGPSSAGAGDAGADRAAVGGSSRAIV